MDLKFTAKNKDYTSVDGTDYISIHRANRILEEKLAKCPMVYGPSEGYFGRWSEISGPHNTNTARIIDIKEIK